MQIKKRIMLGNALPDIATTHAVCQSLKESGFEMIDSSDLAPIADPGYPWHRALQGRYLTWKSIPHTPIGRILTNSSLQIAESLRLIPKGIRDVSSFLNSGADALVAGGDQNIFTPMFFFLAVSLKKVLRNFDCTFRSSNVYPIRVSHLRYHLGVRVNALTFVNGLI